MLEGRRWREVKRSITQFSRIFRRSAWVEESPNCYLNCNVTPRRVFDVKVKEMLSPEPYRIETEGSDKDNNEMFCLR